MENWNFDRNSTGAIKLWSKLFFQLQEILGNFWKIEILTEIRQARTLQKVRIVYYLKLWKLAKFFVLSGKLCKYSENFVLSHKNIFWLNYLFHSSKEVFLHNFRQFLENWNFDRTGADLTNIVKILYYLVLWKYFLQNYFLTVFGKLNFWQEFNRRDPYKNSENFVLS